MFEYNPDCSPGWRFAVSSGDARLVIVTGGQPRHRCGVARPAGVRGYAVAVNYLLADEASYTAGAILEIGGGR